MASEKPTKEVWQEIASMINSLPPDQRQKYQRALLLFVHDLRQSLGIIYSAETLLRRKITEDEDIEILNMIRSANKKAVNIVTEFAQPLDGDPTLPVNTSSPGPEPDEKETDH